MSFQLSRSVREYAGMIFGAMLYGVAASWFLIPYKIVPGGISGLSQIFFHFFGFPAGTTALIMNIPLFIVGFVMLGRQFGLRTFIGMFLTNIMIDFFAPTNLHQIGLLHDITRFTFTDGHEVVHAMLSPQDIYLSAISGSVIMGLGLGLIFRCRGSTGGTDIPVAIIKDKTGLSIGTGYWLVESLIILTIGAVFADLKIVIWGYINLFITSRITDMASEGLPYVKAVYVITEKSQVVRDEIYRQLGRGVTFFKGEGGFSQKSMDILFCVMGRTQVSIMRELVRDIDPSAFMVVAEVNDVMGDGFKTRALEIGKPKTPKTKEETSDEIILPIPEKTMERVFVRLAQAQDLDGILHVEEKCFGPLAEPGDVIKRRLELYPQGFFIIKVGNVLAGYISSELWPFQQVHPREHFTPGQMPDRLHNPQGTELYISSIAVLPSAQGLGLGTCLLNQLEAHLVETSSQVKSLVAIVADARLRARRIYEHAGFVEVERFPAFFVPKQGKTDGAVGGIVMRKQLNKQRQLVVPALEKDDAKSS